MAKTKSKSASAAPAAKVIHTGTTTDGHTVQVIQAPEVKNKRGRVVNGESRCTIEVAATGFKSFPFPEWECTGHTGTTNHRSGAEYLNTEKKGKIHSYAASVWAELTGTNPNK